MSVYEQIAELQRQRDQINADFEVKLVALRAQGAAELEAARKQVAALEAVMGGEQPLTGTQRAAQLPSRPNALNPIDETDFGMGVAEGGGNGRATYQEFTDDLAEMRERGANRPARLARR